jgi:hypothetical protein
LCVSSSVGDDASVSIAQKHWAVYYGRSNA